jgi:hypothetical protein
MKKSLVFVIVILFSQMSMAQYQTRTQAQPSWRRNTAIVLFAGIGGSLLGLSTLSFYGEPKEHTNNINIGALLGLIGGVTYVVHENSQKKAPARTYDYYGLFPSSEMVKKPTVASVPSVNFEFTF